MSIFLIALLLLVLFGGSRVGAVAQGFGAAVRHVKRAIAEDADSKAPAPTMTDSSVSKEPKLLPAKGESSAPSEVSKP